MYAIVLTVWVALFVGCVLIGGALAMSQTDKAHDKGMCLWAVALVSACFMLGVTFAHCLKI